jgi:hypothetical protein
MTFRIFFGSSAVRPSARNGRLSNCVKNLRLAMQYYIPQGTEPKRAPQRLRRNPVWIALATVLVFLYVVILGRGITLRR